MARSGDLEIELPSGQIRRVVEPEVIRSHHRRQRYRLYSPLRELLDASWPSETSVPSGPAAEAAVGATFVPDEKDAREFILAHLAVSGGDSSSELAARYANYLVKTRAARIELPICKVRIEEIARRMYRDGLIGASPLEDGLYLLPKP
jgi:hypothetical protein